MIRLRSLSLPRLKLPSQRLYYFLYFTLLVLCITDRWILLEQFTFRYVDDDQSIMWYGAKEYAAGNFDEPCFYGQAYNTMTESLFAVPLIWCGVSYPVALTVMMSAFTMFPFILLSWLLFRTGKGFQSLLLLAVLLLLPVEFGMLTAISRGLMTGVFFAGIAITGMFVQYRLRFLVFGFFGILALYANPSSLLLLFPAGIYLLSENFRNRSFYLQSIAGALPAAAIWIASRMFYISHPDYVVHGNWNLATSLKIIKPYEWNKFFDYVTPVFWHAGWLVFPMLLAIAIVLIRQKQKSAGYSLIAGVVLLFFSLTILKVHHGFPTVFLSWARMFLVLPLLIAVFFSKISFSGKLQRFAPLILFVPLTFFLIKCSITGDIVHREIREKQEHEMYVSDIDTLNTLCRLIRAKSQEYSVDLIVVGEHYTKHLINYGCPCLVEDLPVVIEPKLDRRTWLLDREAPLVRKNILFVGIFRDMITPEFLADTNVAEVSQEPYMLLLKNNSMTTEKVLEAKGFPMRAH